jgi:hypothetical protein
MHYGMLEHRLNRHFHVPTGFSHSVKTLLVNLGKRYSPLLEHVIEIIHRFAFNAFDFGSRANFRIGKTQHLTHPGHVAASGAQNMTQHMIQTFIVGIVHLRQAKIRFLRFAPDILKLAQILLVQKHQRAGAAIFVVSKFGHNSLFFMSL